MTSPYRIFFSHGKADVFFVKSLKPQLEKTGAQVFFDAGDIEHGENIRKKIISELDRCDELFVLFTQSSFTRPWLGAEIGAFIVNKKKIIPFNYGVSQTDLQECGLVSLLGNIRIAPMKEVEFDNYVKQLRKRVQRAKP